MARDAACLFDFETKSEIDLTECGSHVYAEHPSTDILCLGFWLPGRPEPEIWRPGEAVPDGLALHVELGGRMAAHNAMFDRLIWNGPLVRRYGFPALLLEQVECTMAEAYALGLPGALEHLGAALSVDCKKDMAGHRVMLQLSQPRARDEQGNALKWYEREDAPEKWAMLETYCLNDLRTMREVRERLLPLSSFEREVWIVDQLINDRGIAVDVASARVALELVEIETRLAIEEIQKITGGEVASPNAVAQVLAYVRDFAVPISALTKDEVLKALNLDGLPPECRRVLELRQTTAKSSTAKIAAMLNRTGRDQRARGVSQYHAASTGRWGGRGIQTQNLPRRVGSQADVDWFFERLTSPGITGAALSREIRARGRNGLEVLADSLRGFLVSKAGARFVVSDWSAIEARVLAWLAGEDGILEVFRTHGKIYEAAASDIYRVPIEQVTKDQRQVGKTAVLALGYFGGVGAFQAMAAVYGVKVSDERANEIKLAWREANPAIVRYWYALEDAAKNAVLNPGEKFSAGSNPVTFLRAGSFLFCRLPSGRCLSYPFPKVERVTTPWGKQKDAVTFMATVTDARKWARISTHGGVLAENCFAADTLVFTENGLKKIRDIELDERVWDGVEYVFHGGVVSRKETEVILWQGIRVTPNHLMSDGSCWTPAISVVARRLRGVLKFGRDSAPLWWKNQAEGTTPKRYADAIAGARFPFQPEPFSEGKRCGAGRAAIAPPGANGENIPSFLATTPPFARRGTTAIPGWFRDATTLTTRLFQTTAVGAFSFATLGGKTRPSFLGTLSPSKIGLNPVLISTASTITPDTSLETSDLFLGRLIAETAGRLNTLCSKVKKCFSSSFSKSTSQNGKAKTRLYTTKNEGKPPRKSSEYTTVFDIKNCGPRHQFLILTEGGPVVAHNCTQAVARDLLAHALVRCEKEKVQITLHVHDEIVDEIENGKKSRLAAIMREAPPWAAGLPLDAEGFECNRYRK